MMKDALSLLSWSPKPAFLGILVGNKFAKKFEPVSSSDEKKEKACLQMGKFWFMM